jgi:hypothetical protein
MQPDGRRRGRGRERHRTAPALGHLGSPARECTLRTAGTASPSDGIVLERSFAAALGLDVGAQLRLTGSAGDVTLSVVGTAILPSQARYPRSNPGVAWVSLPTLEQLQPDRDQWTWVQALRLADPASAGAVADSVLVGSPTRNVYVQTWEDQRDLALQEAAPLQLILTTYTAVLLAVARPVTPAHGRRPGGGRSRSLRPDVQPSENPVLGSARPPGRSVGTADGFPDLRSDESGAHDRAGRGRNTHVVGRTEPSVAGDGCDHPPARP